LKLAPVVVVASHNPGKVREIIDLLSPFGVQIKSAGELGLSEPDETGSSFSENAALKARAAVVATGVTALADDSGLVVSGLNGAPGIYSARWAGPHKDFAAAIARVQCELKAVQARDHSAKFVCALALAVPQGTTKIFQGEVHGQLVFPPRGTRGFGYDPIFVAEGMRESFGELDPTIKHAISHRARAFAMLKEWLATVDAGP